MDNTMNLNLLLEQMKEKEERDAANAKRIKDTEAAIKIAEEEIKQLEPLKLKLKEDNDKKQLELSRKTIDYELLLKKKEIWTELHKKTWSSLCEKKSELEAIQQSVFANRIAFCDDINDFLDKYGLLQMSRGIFKPSSSSSIEPVIVKTEQEEDEHISLVETVESLENELSAIDAEVEEKKQLKAQLEAEPSCGEDFIRVRNTLKNMKEILHQAEEEVKKVKSEIAQTELVILGKKRQNRMKEFNIKNNQGLSGHPNVSREELERTNTVQTESCERKSSDLKVVKFSNLIETRQIEPSPQHKGILKTTHFKAKSPSSSLRKGMSQGQILKLDQEMKSILFDSKPSKATSSSNP